MHAVILAGGKGTRLKPYTTVLPKPLMPIGDMPILEVILRQLKHSGVNKVTMAVGHLAELLMAFFGKGERLGIEIDYSIEDKPLGTAGPLALIKELDETFIVMNGDTLTDLDYGDLIQYHKKQGCIATIATYKRTVKIDFGVININENNLLASYSEKPSFDYRVSMGIYVFEPKMFKYIPKNQYLDFPDLVQILLKDHQRIAVFPFDGYWLDIGRKDDYECAIADFNKNKHIFLKNNI